MSMKHEEILSIGVKDHAASGQTKVRRLTDYRLAEILRAQEMTKTPELKKNVEVQSC